MPTVLIVEDDPLIALLIDDVLQNQGHQVFWASDAYEAIEFIQSGSETLTALLTDVNLGPGPNGFAVTEFARALQPDLPVIYVTAQSAAEVGRHKVQFSLMVTKPFAPDDLLGALTRALAPHDEYENDLAA